MQKECGKALNVHDLYVHSDTLLIADVLESFRNKYTEMYEFDSAHFLTESG